MRQKGDDGEAHARAGVPALTNGDRGDLGIQVQHSVAIHVDQVIAPALFVIAEKVHGFCVLHGERQIQARCRPLEAWSFSSKLHTVGRLLLSSLNTGCWQWCPSFLGALIYIACFLVGNFIIYTFLCM